MDCSVRADLQRDFFGFELLTLGEPVRRRRARRAAFVHGAGAWIVEDCFVFDLERLYCVLRAAVGRTSDERSRSFSDIVHGVRER